MGGRATAKFVDTFGRTRCRRRRMTPHRETRERARNGSTTSMSYDPSHRAPRVGEERVMADVQLMDRMFQRIMRALVDTGRPPHYAELARALGLTVADGRQLLHDVMAAYPIGWLHPETDYIASFPPLNGQPTQYRVTVGGEQKWFAQCGFEATSVTWLFPGQT